MTTSRSSDRSITFNAARDAFQAEKPSRDQLVASGDYEEPARHGDVMSLLSALAAIQRDRERRRLTLGGAPGIAVRVR